MRLTSIILILIMGFMARSQSYIDSGIRHYVASEFEEALVDFEEAEKVNSLFVVSSVGRLYFYKGMSLYKLRISASKALDDGVLDLVYNDLSEAIRLDSTWSEPVSEVFEDLHNRLKERAVDQQKKARREDTVEGQEKAFLDYIDLVDRAHMFQEDDDSDLLKAEAYHELGDLFFEDATNVASLQKAGKYFQEAIHLYETARYNDPFSRYIIKSLLDLSRRMDDPERVEEYAKLLDLAGG